MGLQYCPCGQKVKMVILNKYECQGKTIKNVPAYRCEDPECEHGGILLDSDVLELIELLIENNLDDYMIFLFSNSIENALRKNDKKEISNIINIINGVGINKEIEFVLDNNKSKIESPINQPKKQSFAFDYIKNNKMNSLNKISVLINCVATARTQNIISSEVEEELYHFLKDLNKLFF